MKKFYILFPAIGLVIFAAFYWQFNASYAEEKAKVENEKKMEREAKARADFEIKKKAVEEAIQLQEKRKIEKAEREKRDADEKQMQIDLKDASDKARDENDRVLRTVDRLKNEIAIEDAALKKLASEKTNLTGEDEFLLKYVKAAEANQKSLEEVLKKIKAADDAAELVRLQNAKKAKSS
jgi:colicin import membrane protein